MTKALAVAPLTDEQRQRISDSRSPYSAEDRIACVMAYIVEGGNATAAAKAASHSIQKEIKPDLLRQWKSRSEWWEEGEDIARRMLQQDLDMKYTRLMHRTESEMVKRLEQGNTVLAKNGDLVQVPVTFKDLVTGHGIISDKRAMLRGEPTSRKEDTGVDVILKLAQMLQQQGEKAVIDGEYEVMTDANSVQ